MRVMVVGASGLIGSAVCARLATRGDSIVAMVHRPADLGLVPADVIDIDLARTTEADWLPRLAGVDAVVNCAGLLQDAPGESTHGVHAAGAAALFHACERAGVRRVIHLSAVGVDRETPTEFSRTKLMGDQALMERDLDWVILRPSVVIGRAAYGGSALMRGLAALPVLPVMPETGPLQIVHLDDLVDAVMFFLTSGAPVRRAFDVVGPRTWSFDETVALLRRWLRWPQARTFRMPAALASFIYKLSDAVAWLSWRPPVRTTARREILRGAIGDPAPLTRATGVEPRDPAAVLSAEPSSVQERWFARLYLLKPLVFVILSLFWITTGLMALGPGWQKGVDLMLEGGVRHGLAEATVIAGAAADICIGIGIAFRRTTNRALYAALAISFVYAIIGTVLGPHLWIDPIGPLLKIWPIMALILVAIAICEDR
ncbi:MAG: SDR family oxidoreductase [Hyphomicrobiales bacterium]|nr:SDR family oxidoreductase [Hyphomicrobiales bacterium]